MTEKFLTNVRIIDPSQNMDEKGSVVIDENGKIKLIGKESAQAMMRILINSGE